MKKVLVYGIGNPYRCDDAAGIKAAQELLKRIQKPNIDVKWGSIDGVAILDEIVGYDQVFFIDSVKTENGKPGDIYKVVSNSFSSHHTFSSHGINFAIALELGRKLNLKMPGKTDIFGIEIEDNESFGEECTEKVAASIPRVVEAIIEEIEAGEGNE